mmetsp:Transcript_14427/g.29854  ORF Transcript_14427/g.29854 Transcript_14427/m.29854 type:complete len:100 (-) Transcript_14427:72-371(-)
MIMRMAKIMSQTSTTMQAMTRSQQNKQHSFALRRSSSWISVVLSYSSLIDDAISKTDESRRTKTLPRDLLVRELEFDWEFVTEFVTEFVFVTEVLSFVN